jgi:hypothetical protein
MALAGRLALPLRPDLMIGAYSNAKKYPRFSVTRET